MGDDLTPRVAEMRTQAAALNDGVVAVNAALETLDSLGFTTVRTFTDELSTVFQQIDAAQANIQELRASTSRFIAKAKNEALPVVRPTSHIRAESFRSRLNNTSKAQVCSTKW
jgi:uncharacterized protein involved in exopolysaccharide biosynthesis